MAGGQGNFEEELDPKKKEVTGMQESIAKCDTEKRCGFRRRDSRRGPPGTVK